MTTLLLSTTGAGTWTPPLDCPAGTTLTVEAWAGGSGGCGRLGSAYGAGGAGGAYASSQYVVSPHDVASGISYLLGGGTAGTSGANSTAGGNTSWSTSNLNTVPNSTMAGAVTGAPGTLPTGWAVYAASGMTTSVIELGITNSGYKYIDIRINGTSSGSEYDIGFSATGALPSSVNQYTFSFSIQLIAGSLANIANFHMPVNAFAGGSYLSSPGDTSFTPTGTLTQVQTVWTNPATTDTIYPFISAAWNGAGLAIDVTFRVTALQIEIAAAPSFFKPTPGYTLAQGGGVTSGITGAIGGAAGTSIGSVAVFSGGSGAAYNVAGSGGGGSGGKDGAGVTGTTAGVGGRGDNTTGGAGGAVKATTPGNAGTANVEGGGGGGGLTTVAGTGGAGAIPGGGGGGAAVATGTGGTGARGQIRLTYTAQLRLYTPWSQLAPILAQ